MKTCTKCGEAKPMTEFSKDAKAPGGLRSSCRACVKAYNATNYTENAEKKKVSNAKWYADNPEMAKANNAKYRTDNPDKVKAASAEYRAVPVNREKIRARKATSYAENIDMERARSAKWQKDNPQACRIRTHNRRARKRENGGTLSKGLADKLFSIQAGKCACCGKTLGKDYHLDHIMPIKLGGSNTDDNIQLLRSKCNHQKGAKHPVDFMQQKGFLL